MSHGPGMTKGRSARINETILRLIVKDPELPVRSLALRAGISKEAAAERLRHLGLQTHESRLAYSAAEKERAGQ